MNELQIYKYENTSVRTIKIDGETWWVLKDICDILDLGSPHKISSRLDEDEKGRTLIPTLGGTQEVAVVNESGLYHVILRSNKPKAKPFRKWVTNEVLPSIRRTGNYSVQDGVYFPPKATSAGEVSSLIKNIRITMERQNSAPRKIARQTELLLRHFGIPVIEGFVETESAWEQMPIPEI